MGFFNHRNIHEYTWEQHTKNLKTIIDYIITKHDLKLKIQDVKKTKLWDRSEITDGQNFVSLYVHN